MHVPRYRDRRNPTLLLFLCTIVQLAPFLRPLVGIAMMHLCAMANAQSPTGTMHGLAVRSTTIERQLPPAIDLLHMPSPYSFEHLGFFCKGEVKMNQLLPLPVMFRLGDVQHAEMLDGKGVLRALHSITPD